MKVLLLPPEVLSVAALILSFVARLTDEDWSLSPSARHIPATVRSLKTKTFVILDSPNEVLLSLEILLHHDQIFSFLSDSLKSILDQRREKNFQRVDSIERTRTLRNVPKVACTVQNKTRGIVGRQLKEKSDWNDGKRQVEKNTELKTTYGVGPPFFIHSDFDAEVTGYSNFWRERRI